MFDNVKVYEISGKFFLPKYEVTSKSRCAVIKFAKSSMVDAWYVHSTFYDDDDLDFEQRPHPPIPDESDWAAADHEDVGKAQSDQ